MARDAYDAYDVAPKSYKPVHLGFAKNSYYCTATFTSVPWYGGTVTASSIDFRDKYV